VKGRMGKARIAMTRDAIDGERGRKRIFMERERGRGRERDPRFRFRDISIPNTSVHVISLLTIHEGTEREQFIDSNIIL
jgi:hypothetical protein